jgi:hypothetical protein
MRHLKGIISFSTLICAVVIITVYALGNNDTVSPSLGISKVFQSATAILYAHIDSGSDFSTVAKIRRVQLPGIIPNDNNNSTLASPSPSFNFANTSNVSNNVSPPPPTLTHNTRARASLTGPTLNDPNLKIEQIINRSFDDATSMAFLGPDDILVLEKNTGKVHRILNGKILPKPLLDVNVANQAERGLLGIAIAKDNASTENGNTRHVFLYYTESGGGKDGDDAPKVSPTGTATTTDTDNTTRVNIRNRGADTDTVSPAGNRLYRYDLDLNNEMTQQSGGVTVEQGFGVITDIHVGPHDGYLYILTLNGSLYRIVPNSSLQ